jgi:hypothetical protein
MKIAIVVAEHGAHLLLMFVSVHFHLSRATSTECGALAQFNGCSAHVTVINTKSFFFDKLTEHHRANAHFVIPHF